MIINIEIERVELYDSLQRTTSYIGAKALGSDVGSFARIALHRDDSHLLDHLFAECRDSLVMALRHQLVSEDVVDDKYRIVLELSESFDHSLVDGLKSSVASYLINALAAKWLSITQSDKAAEYASTADRLIVEITRKIYSKRKPRKRG